MANFTFDPSTGTKINDNQYSIQYLLGGKKYSSVVTKGVTTGLVAGAQLINPATGQPYSTGVNGAGGLVTTPSVQQPKAVDSLMNDSTYQAPKSTLLTGGTSSDTHPIYDNETVGNFQTPSTSTSSSSSTPKSYGNPITGGSTFGGLTIVNTSTPPLPTLTSPTITGQSTSAADLGYGNTAMNITRRARAGSMGDIAAGNLQSQALIRRPTLLGA